MRILILTSSTGGGHDMRADALAEWAKIAGVETAIHRPLETSHPLYRFGVSLYNWIQRHEPRLHHFYFNFLEVTRPCGSAAHLLGGDRFRQTLAEFRPDVLVSVHGSLNHAYFELARELGIRCATCCGELFGGYGFSKNWINPQTDLFVGAVAETCEAASKLGLPEEKIKLGGFLLRPQFFEMQPRVESKELTLLLCASSQGANHHQSFLSALRDQRIDLPVIALCGKSIQATAQLQNWLRQNPEMRVRIAPADGNMAALLNSVSAVVSRPGTGLTSEAIQMGCPLLFNCLGGVMPQERITLNFCRKHGLARELHSVRDLPRWVSAWQNDPSERQKISRQMEAVRPVQNPRDVLAMLAALV